MVSVDVSDVMNEKITPALTCENMKRRKKERESAGYNDELYVRDERMSDKSE